MPRYIRYVVCTVAYLGACQFAFLAFIQNPGNPADYEKARLPDLVDGTASRPFVYRTLLPTSVRLIDTVLPEAARSCMRRLAGDFKPLRVLLASTPADDEGSPVIYLIAYGLEFACLVAFALTLRAAIAYFYAPPVWVADASAVGGVVCLPILYRYISYDYDFPQLFLFTLGLLLLARRNWRWFYPVLVLGGLSKETTVLLVLVHLLGHASQMPRRTLVLHGAAQVALLASVRALLQFVLFVDSPGQDVEHWFSRNMEMIADPAQWTFLFFHFTWVGHCSLVVPTNYNVLFLLLLPLVLWRWSTKPALLRRGVWIAPVVIVLTFFFGQIDEMRDFYEVYVVVFLLAAGSLCQLAPRVTPAANR